MVDCKSYLKKQKDDLGIMEIANETGLSLILFWSSLSSISSSSVSSDQ